MGAVEIISAILILLVSILLIVVIMLQKNRNEGLGTAYGNIGSDSARGNSIDSILSRWTKVLAIVFGVVVLGANIALFIFN